MEKMTMEQWKHIKGYEGLYQVSDKGNVKSLANDRTRKEKSIKKHLNVKHHKARDYKTEYVNLSKNGIVKTFVVHRLVWEAFNGPIPAGYEVDHKDNDPENNRLDNLQLLTHSENNKKKFMDDASMVHDLREWNIQKIPVICLSTGIVYESMGEASRQLNIIGSHIGDVCMGKRKSTYGFRFAYYTGINQ